MIRTVCQDILPEEAGHAQCHEHIWLNRGASYKVNSALCMDSYEKSLRELKDYYRAGGRLIVDAQPTGCGRNAQMLARLSRESGVRIVATAGFHKKEFFDNLLLFSWPEEDLAKLYTREITTGIVDSGQDSSLCRAGILKAAADGDWQSDPIYRKFFEAVAQAAGRTSAPVMIHTEKGNDIPELIRWFGERGISPERLLICHLDRTHHDAGYHKAVLSAGCRLCYDSVHRLKYVSEAEELALLQAIKKAGFLGQIVLSLDTTAQRLRSYQAEDMGLDYLLDVWIPQLQKQGFTDGEIRQMCVTNAAELLDFTIE